MVSDHFQTDVFPIDSEDSISIVLHIKTMQDELKKGVPNAALIDDKMKRTLVDRRQLVKTDPPLPLADILACYPELTSDVQVSFNKCALVE